MHTDYNLLVHRVLKLKLSYIVTLLALLSVAMNGIADNYDVNRKYDMYFLEAMTMRQKGKHTEAFNLLQHCRQLRPEASEAYYFLAQYLTEMKQQDRAFEYFRKAAELDSTNITYMETLMQAYIGKEMFKEATETAERIYNADKGRQEMLELIYKLYMQQRNYEKAVEALNRMENIDGKSEQLALAKSQLYVQMGNTEAAQKEMKELSEQYPNDLNYRTLYANSLKMSGTNKELRQEAHRILEDVLREEPDNYVAQMSMRSYYVTEGDTLRADSLTRSMLLNRKTALEDKVSLLRHIIGQSEQNGGDSTKVLQLFHEILAQPEPEPDMAEFCAAYMNLKKMPRDSVSAMLEKTLQLAPDHASARLQLVQYAWEDGNNDRVIELCKAARQYNPEEMAFYYYQGMAYYQLDDRDNSLEAFQNGISVITEESNPAIVSDFYSIMGDLLHQKGREQEAFAAYDSCLQWKDDNIGCLNNYAYFLSVKNEQLERAEQMSHQTIMAEPRNSTYLDTYAWILFRMERYDEARSYIEQALNNDSVPSHEVLEHAGDIYANCGDMEKAVEYWMKAQTTDKKNKILNRKIKRKKYIKR